MANFACGVFRLCKTVLVALPFVLCCVQVCYLEFDRKDIPMNKMVITSLESKFSVFDLRTQHPTKGFAMLTEKVQEL